MRFQTNNKQSGSVLAATLVTLGIIGVGLASYLGLVRAQYRSVARSQAWNDALPVAESGLEEALTELHQAGTNIPGGNWTASTNRIFTKTANVGSGGSYYTVSLQMSNTPVITSVGYTLVPGTTNQCLSRTIRVKTRKDKTPGGGLTAKGKIGFSGGAFLDSFDSSDTNYSVNGMYSAAKRKDNGIATSNSSVSGAISASGGGIYGTATTGPGGTVTTSGSAKVGDAAFWASGSSGVQAGHSASDANVDFETITAPFTTGLPVVAGAVGLTNYTAGLLLTGNYYVGGNLTVPGGGKLGIAGDAVLYVNGDFTISGSGFMYMYTNSTLKMYVSGKFTVSGGGIMNNTLKATKLSVYGVNTTQAWTYSGSAAFIGTVYSPNSDFTFSGGSGASGSFTANNVTISGSAGVHFDEDLVANKRGYVVTSWNEL